MRGLCAKSPLGHQVVPVFRPRYPRRTDPAQLACSVRRHRRIEAALHWISDVVCGEDHSQTRTHNGPHDVAVLHTVAINALRLPGHPNIAAGLRRHASTAVAAGHPRAHVTTCQGPGPFLIFGVGYLVWHLSQYLVLEPGDLIVTGTPEGVAISGASRI